MKSVIKSSTSRVREKWGTKRYREGTADDYAPTSGLGQHENTISSKQNQAKYFKGHVHAAVRVVANRVARQRTCLALAQKALDEEVAESSFQSSRKLGKAYCEKHAPKSLQHELEGALLLDDHPLSDAFVRPNSAMTMYAMYYITVVHLEIHGEAYWLYREEGGKREFWPVPPEWINPDHSKGLFAEYQIRWPGVHKPETVKGGEVIRFYYPDPSDPVAGAYGPLEATGDSVLSAEAITQSQRISFLRSINPGLALIVGNLPTSIGQGEAEAILTNKQRDKLVQTVMDHYAGFWNDGKPLILDGFIKDAKKVTGASPRELDFPNSTEQVQGQIEQGFGVNPITMGRVEGSNRAASATADDHLLNNVVNPLIDMISQTLTAWVQPRFPVNGKKALIMYLEQARSTDIEFDLLRDTAMIDRGALSRNEWRIAQGRAPIDDGNSAIVGGALVPINVVDSEDRAVEDESGNEEVEWNGSDTKQLGTLIGVDGIIRVWDRHEAELQWETQKALGQFFQRLRGYMLHTVGPRAAAEVGTMGWDEAKVSEAIQKAMSDEAWTLELQRTMKPFVEKAAQRGAEIEWNLYFPRRSTNEYELKTVPVPPRIFSLATLQAGKQMAMDYWSKIVPGIRGAIASAVVRIFGTRKNIAQAMNDAVTEVIGDAAGSLRGKRITDAEIGGAMAGGSQATQLELSKIGVVYKKKWVAKLDNVCRDTHEEAHGQVVGVDEPFTVGGELAMYPKDPRLSPKERCNCRCISVAVTVRS